MFVSQAKLHEAGKETWVSLVERFAGNDTGSAEKRMDIVGLLRENINPATLTFGHGVKSSFRLMGESGMGYVSFEAALLAVLYEAGLLRLLMLALFIIYIINKAGFRLQWRGEFLLGFAQVFLLLPIGGFTALEVFCLGALCVQTQRPGTIVTRSASAQNSSITTVRKAGK